MTHSAPKTQTQDEGSKSAPLSLKLSPASRQRLRRLAEQQSRPAHALAREAIEAYLTQEEDRIRRNQEAEAAWQHHQDTGLHATGDEVIAWIRSWGTPDALPKPTCHV